MDRQAWGEHQPGPRDHSAPVDRGDQRADVDRVGQRKQQDLHHPEVHRQAAAVQQAQVRHPVLHAPEQAGKCELS